MAVIRVTLVDSPEKLRNQSSGISIIIPQVRNMVPLSEHQKDKKEPHSDVKPKE